MRRRKLKLGQTRGSEERKAPAPDSTTIKTKNKRRRPYALEYSVNPRGAMSSQLRQSVLKMNRGKWFTRGRYRTYAEAVKAKQLNEIRYQSLNRIPFYIYRIVYNPDRRTKKRCNPIHY